jgi:uncharacterized protein (TIGR00269 family)
MFTPQDRILVALSGGKDSLGLMWELKNQGYDVHGLHIDLGIGQSSAMARQTMERFRDVHGISLEILETAREGLAIPAVKAAIRRPICSACGQIKRYYFNKVALEGGYTVLATGHNLDDETSRLFANALRWDTDHLRDQAPDLDAEGKFVRKVKPLYRLGEYETASFAFLRGIEIWSKPCPYSGGASFTVYKKLLSELEGQMRGAKIRFYDGFLERGRPAFAGQARTWEGRGTCATCGFPTGAPTGEECGVCRMKRVVRDGKTVLPDDRPGRAVQDREEGGPSAGESPA